MRGMGTQGFLSASRRPTTRLDRDSLGGGTGVQMSPRAGCYGWVDWFVGGLFEYSSGAVGEEAGGARSNEEGGRVEAESWDADCAAIRVHSP